MFALGSLLSRFIYKFFVELFSRLGFYKTRYLTYTIHIIKIVNVLKKLRSKVLCIDLGCGDGTITKKLPHVCDDVCGIDIRPFATWIQQDLHKTYFIISDARMLPIRSKVFDIVIVISLLEHVPQWGRIIEEASRILKCYGILIIQIPNLWFILEPHTKFPLLAHLPKSLRDVIARNVGYSDLQFDCKISNVIKTLSSNHLRLIGVYSYYHGLNSKILKIFPAPSYFIAAIKDENCKK